MYVEMPKSQGLEFTKSLNHFLKLQDFCSSFRALWIPLPVNQWKHTLKSCFCVFFFFKWRVYFFKSWKVLFCCPNKPTSSGSSQLSLNLAFSSWEQSRSFLFLCSKNMLSSQQPSKCTRQSPLWTLFSFFCSHFCWAQTVTFSVSGHFCPSVPAPNLIVCHFHAMLFLKIQSCSHWPQNRILLFLLIYYGCRQCLSSERITPCALKT